MGKKKQPHYRIVVADSRAPRDGRFVENLGHYNPVPNPARLVVDLTRVDYWLGEGAIPSPTVGNLVSKARSGGDDTVALGESVAAASAAASAAAAAVAATVPTLWQLPRTTMPKQRLAPRTTVPKHRPPKPQPNRRRMVKPRVALRGVRCRADQGPVRWGCRV